MTHKGVAARNSGHYSRQARQGPGGFVSMAPGPLPGELDAVLSWARAWETGELCTLEQVPAQLRAAVKRYLGLRR